jgi:hypothetical protein
LAADERGLTRMNEEKERRFSYPRESAFIGGHGIHTVFHQRGGIGFRAEPDFTRISTASTDMELEASLNPRNMSRPSGRYSASPRHAWP